MAQTRALLALLFLSFAGCEGNIGGQIGVPVDPMDPGAPPPVLPVDPVLPPPDPMTPPPVTCTGEAIDMMPKGVAQLMRLCARGHGDPISQAFCAGTTPNITSVNDVLRTIGLAFGGPITTPIASNGAGGNPGFIMTAQSTSITTRRVSPINPRSVIFTPPLARGRMIGTPKPNPSYVAFAFTRGDQEIELLAKDPTMNNGQGDLRFFLLKYEQPCNASPQGCTPGDLYTPSTESGFTGWTLYDDSDLKNTTLDCLQCHQPDGPATRRIMRMQELQAPWQHWMYNDSLNVAAIRTDFHAAHGFQEPYGGIPGAGVNVGDAPKLEAFIENNGFINQPNEFMGKAINTELTAGGTSATWQALYAKAQTGQFIPVPYYDVIATDPAKVQPLIQQYKAVMAGTLPSSQLGDLADVFSDAAKRAMGHKPAAGLNGAQLLVQSCHQCHNSNLDQTISRSRFDVSQLSAMTRFEKDEAIRRIKLPGNDCSHMPPARFRELDAAEIALMQAELEK